MKHTAILPDFSDNDYGRKRKEIKGYTSDGQLIGEANKPNPLPSRAGEQQELWKTLKTFAQAPCKRRHF